MTMILAMLSPFIVIGLIYLFERRVKRIRKQQAVHLLPVNKPDFEDEISTQEGVTYSKKSSVDDRLIEIDRQWNDPMF
jgi:hypothetical protein